MPRVYYGYVRIDKPGYVRIMASAIIRIENQGLFRRPGGDYANATTYYQREGQSLYRTSTSPTFPSASLRPFSSSGWAF
jgi:hypothetical protein